MENVLSQSAKKVQDRLGELRVSLFVRYAEIWAAAGTPRAVFRLTPAELKQITRGAVVAVR